MRHKRYRLRLALLFLLMGGGIFLVLTKLKQLQIEQQAEFITLVPGEKTVTIREPGIRGEIVDRNGQTLAGNTRSYELDLNLQEIYRYYKEGWEENPTLKTLGRRENNMPAPRSENDIVAITKSTILPRLERFGFERRISPRALRSHYLTHKGMIGFNYADNLTQEEFFQLAENADSLPGVSVLVRPRRVYPLGSLAGHLLGYTKLWEKGDIPESEKNQFDHYQGDGKGFTGVELTMDKYLRGTPGTTTVRKGPKGKYLGVDERVAPKVGASVRLTIDAGLQGYVETLLQNTGRAGAVVLDAQNGEILALASVPSYDPNEFIPRISTKDFKAYTGNQAAPLINRAVAGLQPGSVFKLPVAAAAAQANLRGFSHFCSGEEAYGRKGDLKIRCWLRTGHGSLNMTSALQRSCNPYFMALANQIGGKKVVDVYSLLGFGRKSGINITGESAGIVPGSAEWRRSIRPGESLVPATLAQLAIGQADSLASPLQVASAAAALCNGGKFYAARLIKSVEHPEKGLMVEDRAEVKIDLLKEGFSQAGLEAIRKGMWRAVNETGGTASRVRFDDTIEVAAKTGTAQTYDLGKKSNNAWTVAFAPYDQPRYVVCVAVQGGTSGGAVAGPLVREILRGLFSEDPFPIKTIAKYLGNVKEIDELILEGPLEEPPAN